MRIVSFRAGSLIPHKCALLFWSLVAAFAPQCLRLGIWLQCFLRCLFNRTLMSPAKDSKYKHSARSVQSLLFCPSCLTLPATGFIPALLSAWNVLITFQLQFYMFLLLNHYFPVNVKHVVYYQCLTFIILIIKN